MDYKPAEQSLKAQDTGKVTFEEALNRTGFGLYSYLVVSLAGLIVIALVCIAFGSTIIVPTSACELATTTAQRGILAGAPVVGLIIGAVLWGYLADIFGRRYTLMISLITAAAMNALASISVNWLMLMFLQFFATLLSAGQFPQAMTIVGESVPLAKRNMSILLVSSIFLFSQGLMAVLAIPIIPLTFSYHLPSLGIYWNSWRTLMLVYSCPSLIAASWLYFMCESPKFLFTKGRESEAMEALRKIHRLNNLGAKTELDIKDGILLEPMEADPVTGRKSNQCAPLFRPPLLKSTIIMTILFLFQQVPAFLIWLPTITAQFVEILETGSGSELTLCGVIRKSLDSPANPDDSCTLNVTSLLIVLVVGAIQSVTNVIISLVINATGRRNMAMLVAGVCGACGVLVNLIPHAVASGVVFFVFLLGIVNSGLYTAIAVALFPTSLRALAVALIMTGHRVGSFASVQIINQLFETSCEAGFYVYGSIFACFGLYSYLVVSLAGLIVIALVCIAFGSTIIVPTSACELATTTAQRGILAGAPVVGLIIGAVLWGYLADIFGRRYTLMISLITAAAMNALASISVNWLMLMFLQFFATLLSAGQFPQAMTIVGESVPLAKRNMSILLVSSIFLLSQGLMAVLAIPIIPLTFSYHLPSLGIYWNSWRTLMLVYSCPSLIAASWLYFMCESPKFLFTKGRESEAMEALRKIHRLNNLGAKTELDIKDGILLEPMEADPVTGRKSNQCAPLFRPPLLKSTIIMTILFLFQQVPAFLIWLPTITAQFVEILETGSGSELTLCGVIRKSLDSPANPDDSCTLNVTSLLIVLVVGAIQSVTNVIISLVINATGRRNMAMLVAGVCGACGVLVNLIPHAVASGVVFFVFLLGIVNSGLYTAIAVALFPTSLRALAVALIMTGHRVGSFASVQIINQLFETSCEAGFYVYGSIFALSCVVAAFLVDDRKQDRELRDQERVDSTKL